MTSSTPQDSFAGLEPVKALPPEVRRKQLRHRSRYRGIKEMDMIMSQFCDAVLSSLDEVELSWLEALMRESDHDLYAWKSGRSTPPEAAFQNPMLQRYLDFDFQPVTGQP